MKTLFFLFLLCTSCSASQPEPAISLKPVQAVLQKKKVPTEVLSVADSYKHVAEKTNNNDHSDITKFLKYNGLGPGYAWCQAYTNYVYYEAFLRNNTKTPFPKFASCARFAKYCMNQPLTIKTYTSKQVLMGAYTPVPGDIASFKHGPFVTKETFSYNGHVGIVTAFDKKTFTVYTIEGNTKPGPGGDQRGTTKGDTKYGHDGVYVRSRKIGLTTKFPILYFIKPAQTEFH